MKSFAYAAPQSIEEATALLSDKWGLTEILAGGTDLVTCLKQRITQPERVVSLRNVAQLKGIGLTRVENLGIANTTLRFGAMTTLAELANSQDAQSHFPSLTAAVRGIGAEQILSIGTVGGDLCQRPRCWYYRNGHGLLAQKDGKSLVRDGDNRYHALFGNDGPALFVSPSSLGPALIALGATFSIAGLKGKTRDVAAADFFRTPKSEDERETVLQPNEILTRISVPTRPIKSATYEVRHRHGLDWPYVTASVAFRLEAGRIADAQVVLGHVAPVPWVASAAAKVLNGQPMSDTLATQAADAATAGAMPLSGNAYKIPMLKAAVKRVILTAAG